MSEFVNSIHSGSPPKKIEPSYTGFDSVVRQDRQQRKFAFGPNSVQVRKPNNILIDIYGVISPWNFVHKLKLFCKDNMASFIRQNWSSSTVKIAVARIREQAQIERQAGINIPEILPETHSNEDEIIESAIKCIEWLLVNEQKTLSIPINNLCTKLWFQSYENGSLKSDVYDDVVDSFHYWRFEEFIKIYSYASGSVEGQRLFFHSSTMGDLNRYIANGLNSSGGYKFDPDKFKSLCSALRESKPEMLLYITDEPRKARSAITAGLSAIVVNRTDSPTGKYDPNETKGLTVVNALSDIQFVVDPNSQQQCC